MANTIRIKRRANGGGAGAPASLANAELAFNEQTNILYYGTGTGGAGGTATSVIAIAGNGAFVDMSSNQTIGGIKTFTSTISGSIDGNAGTATKWATARDLSLTGDGTATLTAVDGSANVSAALTLATVNSNIGTYTKITINAKGLATAGSQASLSDLSSPTGNFSFASNRLTDLADPVANSDAANKGYVASASAWSRSSDADTWQELVSAFTFVEQGTTQADTGWVCTVNAGGTLGSTAVTWAQFSGAGTYSAGDGLSLTGTTFAVVGTTNRISVSASGVDIASTYVGQSSITTLGTIGTGTWQATTIGTGYGGTGLTSFTSGGAVYATSTSALTTGTLPVTAGGTGATTLTGYVKGSGTSAFTASSTIPNTDITGLGTMSTANDRSTCLW